MNYSTLDKFQGAWLGSMIGSALSNNLYGSDHNKILNHKFEPWVQMRNETARIAMTFLSEGVSFKTPITTLSDSPLPQTDGNIFVEFSHAALPADAMPDNIMKVPCLANRGDKAFFEAIEILLENHLARCSQNFSNISHNSFILEQMPKADLIGYYCRSLSILLPLILLQQENSKISNLYAKIIAKYSSNSALTELIQQDVAVWNYIVTVVLNNQFSFEKADVSLACQNILSSIKAKPSFIVDKLTIVSQAWERGWSVKKLTSKLYQQENTDRETIHTLGLAIALSFYCFASTPRNFMLSVKRAINIDRHLSVPVALLTATISGAYNGRTSIPRKLLRAAGDRQVYQLSQTTIKRLYQSWLGVYDPDNLELPCNLDISKVTTPRIFQVRQSLKIVSQNCDFD